MNSTQLNLKKKLLIIILTLMIFTLSLPNTGMAQEEVLVLSDLTFGSLEIGRAAKVSYNRTLIEKNPAWEGFTQYDEGLQHTWEEAGDIFLGKKFIQVGEGVAPSVLLITYGIEYNWEPPKNGDLISRVVSMRNRMWLYYSDWVEGKIDKTQYPGIQNAATYSLFRFFDGDLDKLDEWEATFWDVFKESPTQAMPEMMSRQASNNLPSPFLRKPFAEDGIFFVAINSFFDHEYPVYSKTEGDGESIIGNNVPINNSLVRFDGSKFPHQSVLGVSAYSGHPALDYDLKDRQVRAAAGGEIVNCDRTLGALFIRHQNELMTSYLHLRVNNWKSIENPTGLDCDAIARGDISPAVSSGEVIGIASNTGSHDAGTPDANKHLHFGIGYQANISEKQNIDPFGWWANYPDPWENSPYTQYTGLKSGWLWHGDEAGDGYLTVDNRESQAQIFRHPTSENPDPLKALLYKISSGYKGEAYYTFMHQNTDEYKNWAIWGAYIEESGEYEIQAFWPAKGSDLAEWNVTSNAKYILYIQEGNALRTEVLYGNQSKDYNQFITLCKTPFADGRENCPESDIAKFQFQSGSTTVIILSNKADHDASQHRRLLFFDAIRWKKFSPPTPTVTPSPTMVPGQTTRVSITQNSDDAGIAPGTCAFSHPNNEVYFGACANGGNITSGFRFNNIQIPRNAVIEDAYIAFSVDGEYTAPINVNIYGEASSNPPTFSSTNTPAQRPITSAFASWNITDRWLLGEKRNTPNLSMLVQEIVNRGDWNSGNSLAVIFKNAGSGSAHRRVIAIERASWDPNLHPAELVVNYRIGSTPTATPGSGTPGGATSTPQPPTPTPTATLPPTATPQPCFCSLICPQSSSPAALRILEQETPTPIPTPIPSNSSSRSFVQAASDASELATLLYRVRDEVMNQSAEGQRLTDLFYAYAPNLAQVFIAEPALYDEGVLIIKSFVPGLQAMLDETGDAVLITENQVTNMQAFLDELAELGDPDLQSIIQAELARRPLQSMIGMTMNDAWVYLNGYELTWLPPVSAANPYMVQSGRTIPLAFTVVDSHDNFVIDETITLQLVDSVGNIVIGPVGLGTNPTNGIVIQGSKYHYNLRTKDLPAGEYTLQVFYNAAAQTEPAIWTIRVKVK